MGARRNIGGGAGGEAPGSKQVLGDLTGDINTFTKTEIAWNSKL